MSERKCDGSSQLILELASTIKAYEFTHDIIVYKCHIQQ